MGFAGNLRTLSLAEVVQTLNRIKAEGVLRIASQQGTRDVVFANGEIIGVADRDGGDHRLILRRLALMGLVRAPTKEELQQAESVVASLIELGTVTNDQIIELIDEQSLETLYDLNNWTNADFLFHEASESDEFTNQLAKHKANDLKINVNSVLMEAARRHDEWEMIKEAFRDIDVPKAMEGREEETSQHRTGFPGNLLVPLLDGTQSIEDIIENTGLTRFSVFSELTNMSEEGCLRLLQPDELHDVAENLSMGGDQAAAARVFRHILSSSPEDSAAVTALASCLADLGDIDEAAECHAQLALAHLSKDRIQDALEDANRAVELQPQNPRHRGILVRTLVQMDRLDEASDHLTIQAKQFEDHGLIEEARDTWRKVLDLRPNDDSTRHNLAAIQVKQGAGSGDIAVCLECGTVNTRDRSECTQCKAKLQLGCMVCGKTVSVADRICIFCGANPHLSAEQQGPRRSGPSTERVEAEAKIGTEARQKGSAFWRGELRKTLEKARDLEEAGKLEEALKEWREMTRVQQDNVELQKHIRDLEGILHDRFVERQIARGHELRRGRKYYRALLAYKSSLRGIGENDIRTEKLREIITNTKRSHRRIMCIYGVAMLVIAATGILAVKPYYDVSNIESGSRSISSNLESLASADSIRLAITDYEQLQKIADGLHGGHRSRADNAMQAADGSIIQAQTTVLEGAFSQARERIASKDPAGAAASVAALTDLFTDNYQQRYAALQKQITDLKGVQSSAAARAAEAPKQLEMASLLESEGKWGEAITIYRSLQTVDNAAIVEQVTAALASLEPKEKAYFERVRAVGVRSREDLDAAIVTMKSLAGDSEKWGKTAEYDQGLAELTKRRGLATEAWNAMPPHATIEDLEGYLANYSGAAESALARARLAQKQSSLRQREAMLERHAVALKEQQYDIAFQLASTLHQQFPNALPAGSAALPLQILSSPAGATVYRGETVVGKTPVVITYQPDQAAEPVEIRHPGFETSRIVPAEVGSWTTTVALQRAQVWHVTLTKPAAHLIPGPDGVCLAIMADGVQAVAANKGTLGWRANFGEADMAVRSDAPIVAPLRTKDGGVIATGLGTDVIVVGPDGTVRARHPISGNLRAPPVLYRNDLLGGDLRVALISSKLQTGAVMKSLSVIALPHEPLSGTFVLGGDLDRILVIADLLGRLHAVEESSGKILWSAELGAAEIGPIVDLGDNRMALVLDGSRLAGWRLSATGGQELWSRSLKTQPAGAPSLFQGNIHVAVQSQLLRSDRNGTELPSIELPSPASTALISGSDTMAAIGCQGHLVILGPGGITWTTPMASAVTAISVVNGFILAALRDGTLLAYQL